MLHSLVEIMLLRMTNILSIIIVLLVLPIQTANAQDCSTAPYCKNIKSCNEALYHLEICGLARLDRDKDGIPCEAICGSSPTSALKAMKETLKAVPNSPLPANNLGLLSNSDEGYQCGTKKYCREMVSCEEATFHLNKCGLKQLDGDRDGKPCNRLCKK